MTANLYWLDIIFFSLVVFFTCSFFASMFLNRVKIVDIAWPISIGGVSLAAYWLSPSLKTLIVMILVSVWSARLVTFLMWRGRQEAEDWCYKEKKEKWQGYFWKRAFFQIFMGKMILGFLVSSPILVTMYAPSELLHSLNLFGLVLWGLGLLLQTSRDWQQWKVAQSTTFPEKVRKRGLWSITPYPNYLGEVLIWWGIGLMAFSTSPQLNLLAAIGPLTITLLMVYISSQIVYTENIT